MPEQQARGSCTWAHTTPLLLLPISSNSAAALHTLSEWHVAKLQHNSGRPNMAALDSQEAAAAGARLCTIEIGDHAGGDSAADIGPRQQVVCTEHSWGC